MKRALSIALLAGIALGLGACASKAPQQPVAAPGGETALKIMERVALSARDCWFRAKDPAFARYTLAPELDSHSGRPRILIVPASNPGGLPLLVVEGQGKPARISSFGPMLHGKDGKRIADDIARWQGGNRTCSDA
ncbi:hypothetical protein FPY71_09730 [Aureimonas fodinaquatilis]|uniref:Lipoprotein n=1 Tax=Aureimonas fodinaquatilis TaxID=2565783 RepID=A0A5B0DZV2_9HYPH|nr:hypothetical protein [Aureimonas fodinaquatilis]KAA0970749.1 hypothetical protein FPY71_09730 [Aureimonas fodinaquatilis]